MNGSCASNWAFNARSSSKTLSSFRSHDSYLRVALKIFILHLGAWDIPFQSQFGGNPAHRLDHIAYTLPKIDAKLLGSLFHFRAGGARCKGFVLPFLFDRTRFKVIQRARGAYQRDRSDQACNFITGTNGFAAHGVTRQA